MNKKERRNYYITALVLLLIAAIILVRNYGWPAFIGAFLLIWGNNIALGAAKAKQDEDKAKQDLYNTMKKFEG